MRRADRLFEIVQHLRGRSLTTAAQLAGWLEVSERTIYRDIADLTASGVPIEGEAGVGYRVHPSFDLPPLMFTHNEIDALVIGARFVESWGGPALAQAARSALAKIAAALPKEKRITLESSRLFAPGYIVDPGLGEKLESLRTAIRQHRIASIDYRDEAGDETRRRVRPLGLYFWGDRWILAGWCELRADFRSFRLDRLVALTITPDGFVDEPGKRLEDLLRRMEADCG